MTHLRVDSTRWPWLKEFKLTSLKLLNTILKLENLPRDYHKDMAELTMRVLNNYFDAIFDKCLQKNWEQLVMQDDAKSNICYQNVYC